jgi:hypothetical protein
MQNRSDHVSWGLLRINVASMGWLSVISKETLIHATAVLFKGDLSNYKTLHSFYETIATPEERQQMLKAGYTPLC